MKLLIVTVFLLGATHTSIDVMVFCTLLFQAKKARFGDRTSLRVQVEREMDNLTLVSFSTCIKHCLPVK